ncbi:MAG: beta-agarase [Planctomycetota bacterium]
MKATLAALALSIGLAATTVADPVTLTVDPSTVRSIGGITTLEREKYITIHASPGEPDLDDEKLRYIEEELEAHYGRDGGVQSAQLKATPAGPDNPDMPDIDYMREAGEASRAEMAKDPHRYRPESMSEVVLCTHPEWMMGLPGNDFAEFGPRSPEAAAEFAAQFLKHFYTDETRPNYYEVFNEPFVKAKKMGTTAEEMARHHLVTARRIREVLPDDDILIGGYSAAWAEVEGRDFGHWNDWQKMFMDVAGDEMDFFATHLYDGVNVKGTHAERTGGNVVAIMDLIDAYSYIKWGVAKPQVITEYGRLIQNDHDKAWPDRLRRESALLGSFNGMLMMYLDHPDRLIKTVPFILGFATWKYGADAESGPVDPPSDFLLYRWSGDAHVTTGIELFYRFWKGINGERRVASTDDPDIRTHYFADGLRHTLVIHNMDSEPRTVALNGLDGLDLAKVTLRTLGSRDGAPLLGEQVLYGLPDEITIDPTEAAAVILDLREPFDADRTVLETRVYAENYLEEIEADRPIEFTYKNVPTGDGEAKLRLSIGRLPGSSLQPQAWVNGTEVQVPADWAGSVQEGRPRFFGMIEVPVPAEVLAENTTVKLVFPDSGGKVASAVLQTNLASTE